MRRIKPRISASIFGRPTSQAHGNRRSRDSIAATSSRASIRRNGGRDPTSRRFASSLSPCGLNARIGLLASVIRGRCTRASSELGDLLAKKHPLRRHLLLLAARPYPKSSIEVFVFAWMTFSGRTGLRMRGLEPPRPCGHWLLKPARLPIPPHPLLRISAAKAGRVCIHPTARKAIVHQDDRRVKSTSERGMKRGCIPRCAANLRTAACRSCDAAAERRKVRSPRYWRKTEGIAPAGATDVNHTF